MAIAKINLPAAGGVNYNGGNIQYYELTDPVYYVDDNRPLRNLAYRDTVISTKVDEIIDAMGGTENVTQPELDIYKPTEQGTPDDTLLLAAGQHIKSDGSGAIIKSAPFSTGSFATVTAGKEPYDVVSMDDSGNPQIHQGSEVNAGAGDPLVDHATFPTDELVVAIVKVDESVTVVINDADITDVREFLNKGSSLSIEDEGVAKGQAGTLDFVGAGVTANVAGGTGTVTIPGGVGGGATQLYEKQIASGACQKVFNLVSGTYTVGANTLQVFRNGKKLVVVDEYTETDSSTVTLVNCAVDGDVLEFVVPAAGDGTGECYKRDDFVATAGQTTFTTSNTAAPGTANTMVLSGGQLMVHGASNDYTFSGNDVVFNTGRAEDEKVAVIKVTCGGDECCGGIIDYEIQTATANQTVFDLGFTYTTGSNRLFVLVNGVKQILTTDYTETDDDTITLNSGVNAGDKVEFVYYGQAGCNDVRCPPPTLLETQVATQNQTVFNLSGHYQVGNNTLRVYRNGVHQTLNVHYTETNASRVTFLVNLNAGERITFLQMGETGDKVVTQRTTEVATAGQTVFNLPFSYEPGSNDLFVYAGGVLMEPDQDYAETDPTTITFYVGRSPSERIVVRRIGANLASTVKLWEKHVATQNQTTFSLTGTYVVGSKSLEVYMNGQLLTPVDNYAETNESTVTLNFNPNAGDVFIFKVPGGDIISCRDSGLLSREVHTATANQTVFDLGLTYQVGSYGLMVIRNSAVQLVDVDYTETGQSQVTFTSGLNSGDKVEFKNFAKVTGPMDGVVNYKLFDANAGQLAVGQTVIDLPFRYNPGSHMLRVNRNGALLAEGIDYTETDGDTITLNTAIATTSEWVEVYVIASAKSGSRAHKISYHDDGAQMMAPGQTYRDLVIECTNNTQVVIKQDSKVLADNWEDFIDVASDITVDITASGANGLDQGVEASDTWYYIHLIKDTVNGTVAGLLSVNKENPLLPGTYNVHRCVGAVRNDGSSDFRQFIQTNMAVDYFSKAPLVTDGQAGSYTSLSLATLLPTAISPAARMNGSIRTTTASGGSANSSISLDGTNLYMQMQTTALGETNFAQVCPIGRVAHYNGQIYYKVSDAVNDKMSLDVTGFMLNL